MFTSILALLGSLSGLVSPAAGAFFKDWADKRARAQSPDMIAAKEAQVVQADKDEAARVTDEAMHATDPAAKAKAQQELRDRESE